MSIGRELASSFCGLRADDVPADVMQGTRRLLLDTIGCIVSARATEAGAVAAPYAALLGTDTVAAAAYSYGRLADAMDFNDGYDGSHFGPGCVGAALALARERECSGKDLLLAIAAGFELGGRIKDAVGSYYAQVDGKQNFAKVWGIATPIVYAAAGAATRLLAYDEAMTTQAWALAGSNTPIPVGAKWSGSLDLPNTKYCDAGWCTLAGVTGALSAGFGNTGITSLLDDEDGLLRMVSAGSPDLGALHAQWGERWRIREAVYKDWPVCGMMEEPMRLFEELLRTQDIPAAGIDAIEVEVGAPLLVPRFLQQQPRTFVSLQFNLPHALAMLLLRVPPGPKWLSLEFAGRPEVADLRAKVTAREHAAAWSADSRRRACSLKVTAAGRAWFAGSPAAGPVERPARDDAWAVRKFMTLVQEPEAARIVDMVMDIEGLPSARSLTDAIERARPIA